MTGQGWTGAGARVTALPDARGQASTRVQDATASVMLTIDDLFWLSEQHTNMAVMANLRVADLNRTELADMLLLLDRAGYSERFFRLCRPRNDSDGRLRRYLVDREVQWHRVLAHYEFEFWDAGEFLAGFLLGVGQSFFEIFQFLYDLFGFFLDKSTTVAELRARLEQLFSELWELNIPAILGAEWRRLNAAFSDRLLELDFLRAGMVLGKLGADLFGLLAGAAALAKALGKLSRKVVGDLLPLFAREGQAGLSVAQIVGQIGAAVVARAQRVGLAAVGLVTRLEKFADWLASSVPAFFDDLGGLFVRVDDPALVGVSAGERALLWGRPDMPWKVVVYNAMSSSELGRVIDDVIKHVERAWRGLGPKGTARNVERVKTEGGVRAIAKRLGEANEAIVKLKDLAALASRVRDELLDAAIAAGKSPSAMDAKAFGTALHARMKAHLDGMAPKFQQHGINTFTERSVATIAKEMGGKTDILNEPLIDWIKRQPDLLRRLPTGEKNVTQMLEDMGYKATSKVGDLRCDLVLMRDLDQGAEAAIIDWTSDRKLQRLGERLQKVRVERGIPLHPAATDGILKHYGDHALFTLNVRLWVMQRVFPSFHWTPAEVLYANVSAAKF